MAKKLRSTKIFIYISIFGCLLNLVANEEGNFYLTGFEGKSWKFDLNETIPNGKILADELKSKEAMSLDFVFYRYEFDDKQRYIYYESDMKNFNFEPVTELIDINSIKPYGIYVTTIDGEDNFLTIVLEYTAGVVFKDEKVNAVKIGQLKDGTNSLSEFNSAVIEKDTRFVETLTLVYSEEEDEDKCKIGWIIAILFGGTLLAGGLYLLLSRCL